MKINFDKKNDSVYITLHKGIYSVTKKVNENIMIDVDKNNQVLGIEILEASNVIDELNGDVISSHLNSSSNGVKAG